MGSDEHYPEEAPVHRVTVSSFLINRTPVANRQFKAFIKATGHASLADQFATRGKRRRVAEGISPKTLR
jgi:formylglycine-generating enzyme required for sulfatase activity